MNKPNKIIEIKLDSPSIITFSTENGINCKISHNLYNENKFGTSIPVHYSLFMNLKEKNDEGKFILPFDVDKIFGKEIIGRLNEINKIIGRCSQIAERLFDKLKQVNTKFKSSPELESIFKNYISDKKTKYSKFDFMTHRNILSDIIKSKKVNRINNVNMDYDIRSIRTAMYNFILDRNKYTHGELLYWYPEKKTILEYINSQGNKEYAELNMDILNSYTACYSKLYEYLSKIERD